MLARNTYDIYRRREPRTKQRHLTATIANCNAQLGMAARALVSSFFGKAVSYKCSEMRMFKTVRRLQYVLLSKSMKLDPQLRSHRLLRSTQHVLAATGHCPTSSTASPRDHLYHDGKRNNEGSKPLLHSFCLLCSTSSTIPSR